MKVKVTKRFNDKTADFVTRKVGEILDVNEYRADELITKGYAERVETSKTKKTETND